MTTPRLTDNATLGVIIDLDNTLCNTQSIAAIRESNDKYKWKKAISKIDDLDVNIEVVELIKTFRAYNIPVAVVSNSIEHYCRKVLNHMGLTIGGKDADINYIIAYHSSKYHKPHPEPFALAYCLLGGPSGIINIGDDPADIEAGNSLNTALIERGFCRSIYMKTSSIVTSYQVDWFNTSSYPSDNMFKSVVQLQRKLFEQYGIDFAGFYKISQ